MPMGPFEGREAGITNAVLRNVGAHAADLASSSLRGGNVGFRFVAPSPGPFLFFFFFCIKTTIATPD